LSHICSNFQFWFKFELQHHTRFGDNLYIGGVYEVGPEIHLTIADFDMAMLENPNDAPIDPRGAPGRALPVGFIRRSKPDTVTSVATTPTTLKKKKEVLQGQHNEGRR